MIIDSHCHLYIEPIYKDIDTYINMMTEAGVSHALCVATSRENINIVINISEKYSFIFASAGVHPEETSLITLNELLKHLNHPRVIAIGETGLDYYRCESHAFQQQQNFITHILASNKTKLPLIIHTRNAVIDTYKILQTFHSKNSVMHCFSENIFWAKKFLDLGCYISISGIVTFKNAQITQDVAKYVPIDRLLIETDSPYLAPIPYRGKTNHPALIIHTAKTIAELRKISLEELSLKTSENFFSLFQKAKV